MSVSCIYDYRGENFDKKVTRVSLNGFHLLHMQGILNTLTWYVSVFISSILIERKQQNFSGEDTLKLLQNFPAEMFPSSWFSTAVVVWYENSENWSIIDVSIVLVF